MKIAAALFGEEISPRFDCCTGLLVLDEGESEVRLDLHGWTAGARFEEVIRHKPDCLLCGGIRRCDLFLLTECGIRVVDGLTGKAATAVDKCRKGTWRQGPQAIRPRRCRAVAGVAADKEEAEMPSSEWPGPMPLVLVVAVCALLPACVRERCTMDQDCPSPKICNSTGRCVLECTLDGECGSGFQCQQYHCVPIEHVPIQCPDDMVAVQNVVCIDRHEASRVDASGTDAGKDGTKATSRAGAAPRCSGPACARPNARCGRPWRRARPS